MIGTGQSLWEDTIESLEATPMIAVVAVVCALLFHLGVASSGSALAFIGLPFAVVMLVLVAATALGTFLDREASAAVALVAIQLVAVRFMASVLRFEMTTLVVCQVVAGGVLSMGAAAWRRRRAG